MAGALALSLMTGLYGTHPNDPATFVAVVGADSVAVTAGSFSTL